MPKKLLHESQLIIMMRKFFITGTDTGVGKTWVTRLLLDALKNDGCYTAGFKPLACGSTVGADGELRHEDATALIRHSSAALPYDLVNPVCLREPTAPHIAADIDQTRVTVEDLLRHARRFEKHIADHSKVARTALVCEGVGGWDVPVNERESMSDFACRFGGQIILVVGLRLGCLNHARLSARVIALDLQRQGGAQATKRLCGFVVNCLEPDYPFADEYKQALQDSLALPLLATISFGGLETITLPPPQTD